MGGPKPPGGGAPPAVAASPASEPADEIEASRAPLLDHLLELRRRLIVSLVAVAVGFVVCFIFAGDIYYLLLRPFEVEIARIAEQRGVPNDSFRLVFTAPLEFFLEKVKLALFGAVIITFPLIAHQVYAFVAPGLYKDEKAAFAPFLVAAPLLFGLGAALVYYFILPFVIRFAFGQEQVGDGRIETELLPRVKEYLGLVRSLILAFGFSFQLPVLLTLLAKAGLVTSRMLIGGLRYAVVGIFFIAMFMTPPDPFSQIGLGLAVLGLYVLSIGCVRLVERARAKREAEDEEAPV